MDDKINQMNGENSNENLENTAQKDELFYPKDMMLLRLFICYKKYYLLGYTRLPK